jgi:hypothetical protein
MEWQGEEEEGNHFIQPKLPRDRDCDGLPSGLIRIVDIYYTHFLPFIPSIQFLLEL